MFHFGTVMKWKCEMWNGNFWRKKNQKKPKKWLKVVPSDMQYFAGIFADILETTLHAFRLHASLVECVSTANHFDDWSIIVERLPALATYRFFTIVELEMGFATCIGPNDIATYTAAIGKIRVSQNLHRAWPTNEVHASTKKQLQPWHDVRKAHTAYHAFLLCTVTKFALSEPTMLVFHNLMLYFEIHQVCTDAIKSVLWDYNIRS